MPGKRKRKASSVKQRQLMAIAEHHPEQVYSKNKAVTEMSKSQLHEFATTKEKHLPLKKSMNKRKKTGITRKVGKALS